MKKISIKKRWLLAVVAVAIGVVIADSYYLFVQSTQKAAIQCVNGVKVGSLVVLTAGSVEKERLAVIVASVEGRLGTVVDDLAKYEIIVPKGKEAAAREILKQFPEVSSIQRNTCISPGSQ